jgi:hypothetical protein
MSTRIVAGALVLLCAGQSCSFEKPTTKGAVAGGVVGAGLGALIGAASGSWAWGLVIGAGAGALTGYVIANETSSPEGASAAAPTTAADRAKKDEADREFRAAMAEKDAKASEALLQKSLAAHPTPYAHNNLGLLYLGRGDRSAAREQFQKALALDPAYGPAQRNLTEMDAKKP